MPVEAGHRPAVHAEVLAVPAEEAGGQADAQSAAGEEQDACPDGRGLAALPRDPGEALLPASPAPDQHLFSVVRDDRGQLGAFGTNNHVGRGVVADGQFVAQRGVVLYRWRVKVGLEFGLKAIPIRDCRSLLLFFRRLHQL